MTQTSPSDAPAPDREQRREEIRQRAEAATPGPWGRYGAPPYEPSKGMFEAAPGLSVGSVTHTEPIARISGYLLPVEANTDFIAHTREDVPFLLAELARVTALLEAARKEEAYWKAEAAAAWAEAARLREDGALKLLEDGRDEPKSP